MGAFDGLPATDADVCEVAFGDFAALTARPAPLAQGSDGVVVADTYALASASVDFAARGVGPGHVLVIAKLARVGTAPAEVPNDELPILSASGHSVALGRPGYASGQGAYPAGAGTSGIAFRVPSVLAQIRTAHAEILRRLGLTPASTLANPADLRLAAVYFVLDGLYAAEYRQTDNDTWKDKMLLYRQRFEGQMASLALTYGADTPAGRRPKVGDMDLDPRWRLPSDGRGPWDCPGEPPCGR